MKSLIPALLSSLLSSAALLPALTWAAEPVSPAQLMREIDGVYKKRFTSGMIVPGQDKDEPYQAENIVEIVPYDDQHVYLRAHLDFYNGHTCDIAGMAGFEHGAFVYHDPEPPLPKERPCVLRLHVTDKRLMLTDRETPDAEATCRAYCGARGSLDYEIDLDQRRQIGYLARLKGSKKYKKAIQDLKAVESRPAK